MVLLCVSRLTAGSSVGSASQESLAVSFSVVLL